MLEDIATQVAEARQHKAMSLELLSDLSQVSVADLQALESGQSEQVLNWSIDKVSRLAHALNLNISQLLGEPMLSYDEWALVWSALIEYSANRPGLNMKTDMKDLIQKVSSFIPSNQLNEHDG